jgi:hypothetical protein
VDEGHRDGAVRIEAGKTRIGHRVGSEQKTELSGTPGMVGDGLGIFDPPKDPSLPVNIFQFRVLDRAIEEFAESSLHILHRLTLHANVQTINRPRSNFLHIVRIDFGTYQ